ncbi:MAG TPA: hypothetical protein VN757_05160 [Steroidobacteraceae bacterium]|nr:hypothetical protein [Steroidobacteraceae bacterium]
MNALPRLCKIGALAMLLAVLAACVAAGYDGYDGNVGVGVGYVGDYYEPGGYGYGGWGPGYRVGPPGGRDHGREQGHGPGPGVSPGRGHAAPSIPHGGGGHGGGGHSGGGHGGH